MSSQPVVEIAIEHAMLYEVGGFWKLTPDVRAGLISTAAQRKAVGYVNNPHDAGGETKFGIAANANTNVNIKTLTWDAAENIYVKQYWLRGSCDKLNPRVAILHFDGCVNHGVQRANKFLQQALGVVQDGVIGPVSLKKLDACDDDEICTKICRFRSDFYRQIVKNKPSQSIFLAGWLFRISDIEAFVRDIKI